MGMKPNEKGFDIDDSFFDEYEGGPKKMKMGNDKTKSKNESP
jgi:hypothetical protein